MKRALIAGAGNAGLFLAILLMRQGWSVRVVEKAPQLRDGGGALLLWPNATSLLERAGIQVPGAEIQGLELRRWDGRPLRRLPVQDRQGGSSRVVWRGDLLRALYLPLPPEMVSFGLPLPPFEQGPEGVEVEGLGCFDLLVGADGIHSAVRRQIKGEEPVRAAGVTAWVGASDGAFGPPGQVVGMLARGRRFVRINMGHQTYWYAIVDDHLLGPDSSVSKLRIYFRGWETVVLDILDQARPYDVVRFSLADRPPCLGWSEGAAVLVGDAAHPCAPDLGQGTCQALESTATLAEELGGPVSVALRRYEERRRQRTAIITHLARASLQSSMPLDRLRFAWVSLGISLAPEVGFDQTLSWLFQEEAISS